MDNVKGILVLLVLVLFAGTFVLLIRQSAMSARADEAYALGVATRDLLRAQNARCTAAPEQYEQLAECITPLLITDDFREDAFRQPRDDASGYVVIKNTNKRVFQSEEFTFYKNRALEQTGCTVPGEIGIDVTCRFDFSGTCNQGDLLEAYYPINDEPMKIFLKTC